MDMWVSIPMRLMTLLVLAAVPLACGAQSGSLSLGQIVTRMERVGAVERNREPAYTVTRRYQLSAEGASEPSAEVVAQVTFLPPSQKDYAIVNSQGSDRGEKIVRKVLAHEASMAGDWQPHAITSANYDFALLGREMLGGHDCYVLQLSPKREAVELVRGKAWVDARTFEMLRVQGETAKSPSFWLKKVNITIDFGQVNGVWLETSTQAVADVRFAGTHVLSAKELDVRPATESARARKPHATAGNSESLEADTAAWVH